MPRLARRVLEEALDAVKKYGTVASAARAMNIPRETLQSRVQVARMEGIPQAQPAMFIPPELPDRDEPLEETIARIKMERSRQRTFREASKWMPFKVDGDEPFALAFIGDPHVDTCDLELLESDLDSIEKTPRMWAVGLGDWCNAWAGRLRAQYAMQSTTERQAYKLVEWVLSKPFWWLIILGNHNGARWHGAGSPLEWMRHAAAMDPVQWQAQFSVQCSSRAWKVWAAHDFPGSSIYSEDHGPNRRALLSGAEADIYVAGDHHTYTLRHAEHPQTKRLFWSARARGYKPLDNYAEELGFLEGNYGCSIGAVFDPRDGAVECFGSIKKAAQFLTLLRRMRPEKS